MTRRSKTITDGEYAFGFVLFVLLLSSSCIGGQSGTEFLKDKDCNYAIEKLAFNQVSALGFSGAEVASVFEETLETSIRFNDSIIDNANSETAMTVSVNIPDGEIAFYKGDIDECPGDEKLVIPAIVTLVTQNGKLNDTFEGSLEARSLEALDGVNDSDSVVFHGSTLMSEINGSLELSAGILELFVEPEIEANIWFSTNGKESNGNLTIGGKTVDLGPNQAVESPWVGEWGE